MAYRSSAVGGCVGEAGGRVEAFLDDFVDSSHELSGEVRRMLHKLKELDDKTLKTVEQAESAASGKASRYRGKGKPHEGVRAVERDIDEAECAARELGDKKMALVRRLLDLVDRLSLHMDSRLGEFQSHLKRESKWPEGEPDPVSVVAARRPIPSVSDILPPRALDRDGGAVDSDGGGAAAATADVLDGTATMVMSGDNPNSTTGAAGSAGADASCSVGGGGGAAATPTTARSTVTTAAATLASGRERGGAGAGAGARGSASASARAGTSAGSSGEKKAAVTPMYDIPVDPDEPRYCYCNQVSYGDMVACDNEESCEREWFHFSCVGLTETPSGGWRCPDCRRKSRKTR